MRWSTKLALSLRWHKLGGSVNSSYDTDKHAKTIFKRLLTATFTQADRCTDSVADSLAIAAVRMARQFAAALQPSERQGDESGISQTSESQIATGLTFEELVHDWLRHALIHHPQSAKSTYLHRFQRYLFPKVGALPVAQIRSPDLIPAFWAVEDAGLLSTTHQLLKDTIRVFNFAIASCYTVHNPALAVRTVLHRPRRTHRPTILLPERVGDLLRAIDSYRGPTTSSYMLRLMPLVFVRPSELRLAEWCEIDLKNDVWRVPAHRMKGRRPHIAPLSIQAKNLFRQAHRISAGGRAVCF